VPKLLCGKFALSERWVKCKWKEITYKYEGVAKQLQLPHTSK